MGLVKLKPWAGLFCEALMLIFIFLCAHTEVSAKTYSQLNATSTEATSIQQMTYRITINTASVYQALPRIPLASLIKNFSPLDIAGLKVQLSEALTIGHAERNYIYNQLTDNAP